MVDGLSISVVIPSYQRRASISTAIETVLRQDQPPEEVIVVDDGSTDGSADAVRERFGQAVTVIERSNGGPSAARNTGIAAATGDVVAFIDSDNRWLPHHLTLIRAMLRAHPESVLVSTQRSYRFGNERIEDALSRDVAREVIVGPLAVGLMTSMAARRVALVASGGFEEGMRYGEDVDLMLRLSLAGPFTMMRARTFEVARPSSDSLSARGRASDECLHFVSETGRRLVALLADSDRPDAGDLLDTATARVELGLMYESLASGADRKAIRAHLERAQRLVPALAARPEWILFTLPAHVPGWGPPARRLELLSRLLPAWPQRLSPGTARFWAAGAFMALRPAP
jgi:hypothetical protein